MDQQKIEPNTEIKESPKRKIRVSRRAIKILLFLVALGTALYFSKDLFVAAIVNGKPISRFAIVKSLEKTGGKQILDNLVIETLVAQEAKKNKIEVTDDEIIGEIAKIKQTLEEQGVSLDTALSERGLTLTELYKQITLQKQLEKILASRVNVTDEEIDNYIETNSKYYEDIEDKDELRAQVAEQLKQEKLGVEYQNWINDAKGKANIKYFGYYR